MTNQEVLDSVKAYQERGDFHPLTCGNDSNHLLLVAKEIDGKVVLVCPECDYVQNWIPNVCTKPLPPPII